MSEASMLVLSEPLITLILMMGLPFPFVRPVGPHPNPLPPSGRGDCWWRERVVLRCGRLLGGKAPVSGRFANRPYVASLRTAKRRVVASGWFCVIRSRNCL